MNSRIVGIIGVVVLLIGLFVPLTREFAADTATTIDLPASRQFGFLLNGDPNVIAYVVLVLAALALTFTRWTRLLIVLGVIFIGLTYYDHTLVSAKMEAMSQMVATSPENATLIAREGASTWGWYVLYLGGLILIVAGILKPPKKAALEPQVSAS